MLLVGAGLLLNSFLRLQRVDSGLQPEHVTIARAGGAAVALSRRRHRRRSSTGGCSTVWPAPRLQAVGVGFPGPLRAANASGIFTIEGRARQAASDRPFAHLGTVSGGFFAAMGIPLLAGRTFLDPDVEERAPGPIVSAAHGAEVLAR